MKIVSSATMRVLDEATIAAGTPGSVLMERAGRGIAHWIHERSGPATIVLVAGKGNNGGDAFVVARYLQEAGHRIRLFLAGIVADLTGDAAQAADEWLRSGGSICERPHPEDWHPDVMPWPLADVVVDALLGTGSTGAPRGAIEAAVRWINGARRESTVISVDLPTGVEGDSGTVAGEAVVPAFTLTLGLPKPACLLPERCGSVSLIEIGLDADTVEAAASAHPAIVIDDACRNRVWPQRDAHGHKGTFGAVQLVGGSPGMGGAILLSARAAVRAGAGLVFVASPGGVAQTFAAGCPEALWQGGEEDGVLSGDLIESILARPKTTAWGVGPGMGPGPEAAATVRQILTRATAPLVLDADGLNSLQGDLETVRSAARKVPVVLTPHPGEMARLLGTNTATVESDREEAVRDAARRSGAVVLLKGARTLVADPQGRLAVNLNGNPGMATGGSGDVLTGVIAALLARRVSAFDAAVAGAWIHGGAGDRAAWEQGQDALCASSLVNRL